MADQSDDEPLMVLSSTDDEEDEEEDEDCDYSESEDEGESSESEKRRKIDEDEAELNLDGIDGLICPVCMEPWTDDGDHHICCLPCGHIYGMSCINKWLKQRKNKGKCPQCNRKCSLKDVRKLFASRLVAVDEKMQKRIRLLEDKCVSQKKMNADWRRRQAKWRKIKNELQTNVQELKDTATRLDDKLESLSNKVKLYTSVNATGDLHGILTSGFPLSNSTIPRGRESCLFKLQEELQVDGAHLFDIDKSENVLLIARSQPGMGTKHVLTKLSLLHPHEKEDIALPSSTNIVKDLHFSPSDSDLALLTSLGKKLSIFSMENDSVVLSYDLPAAGWSCSWDLNVSHCGYVGLQNGSVFMFDKRQTRGPVKILKGITSNPVHTIHSLSNSSNLSCCVSSVLSASSAGLCRWNFKSPDEESPIVVSDTDKQGVCISLAYLPISDDIVASYRGKVEIKNETLISQPTQTQSQVTGQQGVLGFHALYTKDGHGCYQNSGSTFGCVSQIRLPKSAIIETEDKRFFVSGHEESCDLVFQDLPSFSAVQRHNLETCPLRDIRFSGSSSTQGLLGCLSGNTLQLFKP